MYLLSKAFLAMSIMFCINCYANDYSYTEAGRLSNVDFGKNSHLKLFYDDSSNLEKSVVNAVVVSPRNMNWNIVPAVGNISENFVFQTEWFNDSPFIVKARLRYRLRGTSNWEVAIMDYVSGTPDVGANFALNRSFGVAGEYELQFAANASETESPSGVSSDWLPNDPLVITVLSSEPEPDPEPVDSDSDGIVDASDNCPILANPDQADNDDDSIGNVCDPDDDNDGLMDSVEIALGTNPFSEDSDGDGVDDLTEVVDVDNPTDSDGDGKIDAVESSELDSDEDGIPDQIDPVESSKKEEADILDFMLPIIPAIINGKQDVLLNKAGSVFELKQTAFDAQNNAYTFTTLSRDYQQLTITLKRLSGLAQFDLVDADETYSCPPTLQTTQTQICTIESPARQTWQIKVFSPEGESRYELKVLAKK